MAVMRSLRVNRVSGLLRAVLREECDGRKAARILRACEIRPQGARKHITRRARPGGVRGAIGASAFRGGGTEAKKIHGQRHAVAPRAMFSPKRCCRVGTCLLRRPTAASIRKTLDGWTILYGPPPVWTRGARYRRDHAPPGVRSLEARYARSSGHRTLFRDPGRSGTAPP